MNKYISKSGKENNLDGQASHYNEARNPFGVTEILGFINPGDVVLDGGCGTGHHAKYLAKIASRVEGIDTDAARIAIAQNLCSHLDNVSFDVASVTELPFENNSFEVVTLIQVLHHLGGDDVHSGESLRQQCKQTLMEAKRVLRTDGRLILVTTSRHQRRTAYWHFNLFPKSAWERLDAVWSLTEGSWFTLVMKELGFEAIDKAIPSESHWIESDDEQMVHLSLDPNWRSTDVAFDLLTPTELEQFLERVKNIIKEGSAKNLINEAIKGRDLYGEATVSAYKL